MEADRISLFTIPNIITCFNLLCGCVGVVFALGGAVQAAMVCMLLAAVFDFLDGFAARLLKAYSTVGKQLDSLADMVSFGLLPAAMLYYVMQKTPVEAHGAYLLLMFSPFLLTVFSALRLAKFNVDERQTTSFRGLPTPANALFFASATIIYADYSLEMWVMLTLIPLFSFLLVCEIPMFSLKVRGYLLARYALQLVFLLLSGAAVLLCLLYAIPVFAVFAPIILLYILLNVAAWVWKKLTGGSIA